MYGFEECSECHEVRRHTDCFFKQDKDGKFTVPICKHCLHKPKSSDKTVKKE
jgi:hypothetical protein